MGAPDWREGSIPKAPLPTCSDRLFTLRDYPGLTLKVRSPPGAPFVLGKPEQMVILTPPRRANRVTPRHPDANLPEGILTPAQRLPQAPAWSGPGGARRPGSRRFAEHLGWARLAVPGSSELCPPSPGTKSSGLGLSADTRAVHRGVVSHLVPGTNPHPCGEERAAVLGSERGRGPETRNRYLVLVPQLLVRGAARCWS